MNFDFSDEQKEFRKSARKLLKDHSSPQKVRKIMESDQTYDADLWKLMGENLWMGTTIPEEYGGVGFGPLELVMLSQSIGESIAPVPFSSTVYLAAEAIMMAGSEGQKKKYLPKIAAGECIGTFAHGEKPGRPGPEHMETKFCDGKISGVKTPVMDGGIANIAVVLVNTGGSAPAKSLSWAIVNLDGDGVERRDLKCVDRTRNQAALTFKGAPAELLGEDGEGWALTEKLYDRAAVLYAFEQVGGAETVINLARDYANDRFAFGRAIGSFQAIKHKIVDMLVLKEVAVSNCYFAAWALDEGDAELPLAACAARITATDAFEHGTRENIQVHGGIGYTWEADAHMYMKRSITLAHAIGGVTSWREKLTSRLEAQVDAG